MILADQFTPGTFVDAIRFMGDNLGLLLSKTAEHLELSMAALAIAIVLALPLGLWLGVIGYAVLYSGVIKLGGGSCSLADAFRGQCVPAGAKASAPPAAPSSSSAQAAADQQYSGIPSSPVMA